MFFLKSELLFSQCGFLTFSAFFSILTSKVFWFSKENYIFFVVWRVVMELAKISTRGQITLPLLIRRQLGVGDGDKVAFWEENGRVVVENAFTIEQKVLAETQGRRVLAAADQRQSRTDAVKTIRSLRARCKAVTVDEILAWRDEGRP
jgi:AbrB family looped-hinge helix DNA binding protein